MVQAVPPVPAVPADALAVLRRAFSSANRAVSERMSRLPNIWETSRDQAFIDELVDWSGPVLVESGWTVRIETHFLGGGRHWGPDWDFGPFRRWEIADIGILVMLRQGSKLVRTKLVLLQSKRLYPIEESIDEVEAHHYIVGFRRLFEDDAIAAEASNPRLFSFTSFSEYKMLLEGDSQVQHIAEFELARQTPVHYLLYNPLAVPWSQSHPLPAVLKLPEVNRIGCRVVPAAILRSLMSGSVPGSSPSYGELCELLPSPFRSPRTQAGRRIEDFVERVVKCKDGYLASGRGDLSLQHVFGGRGAPIAAAIGLMLSAPEA